MMLILFKVKKILDRARCQHLQEGDILIEINGRNIRGLPHTEVVQILKECPYDEPAHIKIQRGLLPRVTKVYFCVFKLQNSTVYVYYSFKILKNKKKLFLVNSASYRPLFKGVALCPIKSDKVLL